MPREQKSPASPAHETLTLIRDPEAALGEDVTRLAPATELAAAAMEAGDDSFERRYRPNALLGQGGMGKVLAYEDRRIGREVALKVIQKAAADVPGLRARFQAEARVQGQLEHPAIVPVYDMGVGPEGPYFTMRRVRGSTLEEILDRARSGELDGEQHSRHRLVRGFVQLAQAVAFAHARGIIHRDLKPANTMLGDFGEVYVLDWGLAKQSGEFDPELTNIRPALHAEIATLAGAVVGTPGFMPPEQLRGDPLDARADVYALGAILFECLTLEPLHPQKTAEGVIKSTLDGIEARPTVRAPASGVAPEFDEICSRATASDPADRYATAGELAHDVEAWLNGDRDVALRRELAAEHVRTAREAPRQRALEELNQAIALDPSNGEALARMSALLLEGPAEPPPEVKRELDRSLQEERRQMAKVGAVSFASWALLSGLLFWPGVRSLSAWLAIAGLMILTSTICVWLNLRRRVSDAMGFVVLLLSTAANGLMALFMGPFIIVPALAAQNTVLFAAFAPKGVKRALTIGLGTLAVVVPFLLELGGWIPTSMEFGQGGVRLLPRLTELPAVPIEVLLFFGAIVSVVLPSLVLVRMNDERVQAKEQLLSHLWHLRQLVPPPARSSKSIAPPKRPRDRR